MIEYAMFAALGFLVASILAVLFAGPFWDRAVRLTKKHMEATMPMSPGDIRADKDQLRAQHAVELRRLEMAHDREKENAARLLIERNKAKVEIAELKAKLKTMAGELAERGNESTVLEQTVRKRIPELEQQLERARQIISARDRELARVTTAYENQTEAVGIARKMAGRYSDEIERLRHALASGGGSGRRGGDDENSLAAENQRLQAELSRMRQEVERLSLAEAEDNAALRREIQGLAAQIMHGAPPAGTGPQAASNADTLKEDHSVSLEDAEVPESMRAARSGKKRSGSSLGERLKKLTERASA